MSTTYDPDMTTYAPRGDDSTVAHAWASSPLGDPSENDIAPRPTTPKRQRKPIRWEVAAAGVIALIGAAGAVGMALEGDHGQSPAATPASAAPSAPAAAPDAAPPTQAVTPPGPGPDAAREVGRPASVPAPAAVVTPPHANPGIPPAAPQGPAVTVKAPAPHWPSLPKLPAPPPLCLPPHHLVQGVCK